MDEADLAFLERISKRDRPGIVGLAVQLLELGQEFAIRHGRNAILRCERSPLIVIGVEIAAYCGTYPRRAN